MQRSPYRVHPARLRLNLHGVTVTEVALAAGLSQSAVTRQLSGESRLADSVRDVIVERLGDDAADVFDAIPQATERAAA